MKRFKFILLLMNFILITNINAKLLFDPCTEIFCPPSSDPDNNFKNWEFEKDKNTLYIDLEEETETPITIAIINCVNCADEEDIKVTADNILLKPIIKHIDGTEYEFQIGTRQDYENERQRRYDFKIILKDIEYDCLLKIVDIDDVKPSIIATVTPCVIEENKDGPSDCTFQIYDPDSTSVTYTIDDYPDRFKLIDDSYSNGKPFNTTARLHVLESLDFETQPIYSFKILAIDSGKNEDSTSVIIKVKDVSDMPPAWRSIFATQTFKEHTAEKYKVLAKDGDIEVDATIYYRFDRNDGAKCHENITVNQDTGEINIGEIDRDKPELEDNTIKCIITAYEDETNGNGDETPSEIIFIVQDINDNKPKITLNEQTISMNEGETAQFENIFSVNDIDQGTNAQYEVKILDDENGKYAEAFQVIPPNGYRNWEFSISVIKAELLDYDDKDWQNFKLKVHAVDKGNPSQDDTAIINVSLENMNNNAPKFVTKDFTVSIPENSDKNTEIIKILANDKDTDDFVSYEITMGGDKFEYVNGSINTEPITVYPKKDNVFDYEKQTEVFFQITVQDNLIDSKGTLHKVSQQVTINVIDVNDEKPRITLLSKETPEVNEHLKDHIINNVFEAEDVDTDAELEFSILWDDTYAMKEGRKKTDKELFEDVFEILAEYDKHEDGSTNYGKATVSLKVKDETKLDWEEFENLYLKVQANDRKQVENKPGTDVATIAIIINDINDCPPILEPISKEFFVVEEATKDTYIGSVLATDKDGPPNNVIIYELIQIKGTKEGLVKIDKDTGSITVDQNKKIDADCPPTKYLYYNVIAKDPTIDKFKDTKELQIEIIDTNNKAPRLVDELKTISFVEGKVSEDDNPIIQINATDDDRDEPYNKLIYEINGESNRELLDYFKINEIDGKLFVKKELLWTAAKPNIQVYVIVKDNEGQAGFHDLKVNFTLNIEDVDNNNPVLIENTNFIAITEAAEIGTTFGKITATDADKPCTDATKIDYEITKIIKINENILEDIEIKEKIFRIETKESNCNYHGDVITNKALKEYFGKFRITVTATNPISGNKDEKDYDFEITAYNFREPKITYPVDEKIILRNEQKINDILILIDNNRLSDFTATDNQNDKFRMGFTLETIQGDDIFKFKETVKSAAQLQLKKLPDNTENISYKITVKAAHNGTGSAATEVSKTYSINFFDVNQLPLFDQEAPPLEINENDAEYCGDFPEAIDPKCTINIDKECTYTTYYHIFYKTDFFEIRDPTKPTICVTQPLDYENKTQYELFIIANNNNNTDLPPEPIGALKLIINVQDVNDEWPVFDTEFYLGGMSSGLKVGSEILTVHATDIDTVDKDKLRYEIVEDSIVISDKSLETVKDKPFEIDSKTGLIRNNFSPVVDMKGYLTFQVNVFDSDDLHNDTTEIRISIITDDNKISFTFKNDVDLVKANSRKVSEIFSNILQYDCSIDGINKKTESGVVVNDQTEVITHFINPENNEPVPEANITAKTGDIEILSRLSLRFEDIGLELSGIKKNVEKEIENMENLLRTLLIVVSVVLGSLIVILIIAFILRTRSLNKRLESMTTNIFGSTKSDLNRIGTSAPGTNKHAVEANPVWNTNLNNGPQFDSISQTSGGSDLIGIEDNPEFQYTSNRRDSINPMYRNNMANTTIENEDDDINSLPGSNI